ncbi:hypothetical protein ScPMuIL_003090 [Solemya velum]
MELPGTMSAPSPNDDSVTFSYTWTSNNPVVPGPYTCSVGNLANLKKISTFSYGATLDIFENYGVLYGRTQLLCTMSFGTVTHNSVTWSTSSGEIKSGDEFSMSRNGDDTFLLTIEDTQPFHLQGYTCTYESQAALYILTNTVMQGLSVRSATHDSKITIFIDRVRPSPPSVTVELNNAEVTGTLNTGSLNGDGLTYSYTWTTDDDARPGTYTYTVNNGADLTTIGTVVIPAKVSLVGSTGIFAGETALVCSLAAGTVTDDGVTWSSPYVVDLSLDEKYDVMQADGDTFTMKIKETRPPDFVAYTCNYGQQTATYSLTHASLQALIGDIVNNATNIIITFTHVKPPTLEVGVVLDENGVTGMLSDPTLNSNGFTYSYTWTSTSAIVPGVYDVTYSNGAELDETLSYTVPATLDLVGNYGVFAGETRLMCTLEHGSFGEGSVRWLKNGVAIEEGTDYELSQPGGPTSTLTITNTLPASLAKFSCEYGSQEASYALVYNVIQALVLHVDTDSSTITIDISNVRPSPPTVTVKLNTMEITGNLGQPVLNADGFTYSCSWTSNTGVIPGQYKYTVTNGQDLKKTDTFTIPATLTLVGSHGVLGGETKLQCTLGYGTVTDDAVTWFSGNTLLSDGLAYGISGHSEDTFTLTIKDTQPADLHQYTYCDDTHWGSSCQSECTCVFDNTVECSTTDGTCSCEVGWVGDNCENDINECRDSGIASQCPVNSQCVNTEGSYSCVCDIGFRKQDDETCSACDSTHYGRDCDIECDCDMNHTSDCDNADGSCTCNTGWTGRRCQSDINECDVTSNICGVHSICTNADGSYTCSCKSGWEMNSNNKCKDRSSRISLRLNIAVDVNDDQVEQDILATLIALYTALVEGFLKVILHSIRQGSTIVEHSVVTADKETSHSNLSSAFRGIADGTNQLSYNGAPVDVISVSVTTTDEDDITSTDVIEADGDMCKVFNKFWTCGEGTECAVGDGGPRCRLISKQDNVPLVIGLGVGLPLILITLLLVVLCANYQRRRPRQKMIQRPGVYRKEKAMIKASYLDEHSTNDLWKFTEDRSKYQGLDNYPYGAAACEYPPDSNQKRRCH